MRLIERGGLVIQATSLGLSPHQRLVLLCIAIVALCRHVAILLLLLSARTVYGQL